MGTYSIPAENIEKLEKKLATIQNKCKKFGCDFRYSRTGEEFKTVKDENGREFVTKFINVAAEGVACVNGWTPVAVLEHHDEGNVVRHIDFNIEVPTAYQHTTCICEHCNTSRYRKETVLLYNKSLDQFKQVGKSCLRDFTGIMDAERFARYLSWFEELENEEYYRISSSFCHAYSTEDFLRYVIECVNKFGYQNSESERPTKLRAFRYLLVHTGDYSGEFASQYEEEMTSVGFNPNKESIKNEAARMLEWIRAKSDADSEYMFNLYLICKSHYFSTKDIGFIASLVPTYRKEMKREQEAQIRQQADSKSEYVGNIKDKVSVEVKSAELVTSWESMYGVTYLYRFVDNNENVLIWRTSNFIESIDRVVSIKGTVKDHSEFRGCKQTELTRCKVTCIEKEAPHEPESHEVDNAMNAFYSICEN